MTQNIRLHLCVEKRPSDEEINVFDKRTGEKGWYSTVGFGRGAKSP